MRFVSGIILFACIGAAFSAEPSKPDTNAEPSASPTATPEVFSEQTLADLKKLRDAALTSDYAYREVAHLSNNIGPRLTGSAQAAQAVNYVADELKKVGCEVHLEKVTVPHWVRGEETAALIEYPGQAPNTTQKVVLCALGGSVATAPDGLTAEVIAVRNFDEFKSLPADKVKGKIVVFNYRFDEEMAMNGRAGEAYSEGVQYRSEGPVTVAKKGGIACLIRSVGGADYRLPHTGTTKYDTNVPKVPAAALAAEDAEMIAALVQQGPVKMKLLLTPQTLPDAESFNVIGDVKGSEHPEQIVIVSGHLDSWDLGRGAIDDGAGVAVSMETANLVHKLGLHPKRTIRVIAWMNEENGSAGSKAYAADYAKEMPNHFAVMETDNGAGHPTGVNIKWKPELKPMLKPMAAVLQECGAGMLAFSEHCGADIEPMEKLGVPAFSPIQDGRFYFNYHHTAADTLDKIVPKELAENSAVVAVAAYAFANSERPFPWATPEK